MQSVIPRSPSRRANLCAQPEPYCERGEWESRLEMRVACSTPSLSVVPLGAMVCAMGIGAAATAAGVVGGPGRNIGGSPGRDPDRRGFDPNVTMAFDFGRDEGIDYLHINLLILQELDYRRQSRALSTPTRNTPSGTSLLIGDDIIRRRPSKSDDEAWPTDVLRRQLKPTVKKLGTVDFRNFRTMHSSLMSSIGVRPEVTRDNMGHANVDVTQNVYNRTWWEDRVEAVSMAAATVWREFSAQPVPATRM
jgi:hypothetical protein